MEVGVIKTMVMKRIARHSQLSPCRSIPLPRISAFRLMVLRNGKSMGELPTKPW